MPGALTIHSPTTVLASMTIHSSIPVLHVVLGYAAFALLFTFTNSPT